MHTIAALVGKADFMVLPPHGDSVSRVVRAPQGFAIIPVTEALAQALPAPPIGVRLPDPNPFELLNSAVAALSETLSMRTPITYVETEYFGGIGAQAAIVWNGGAVALGPLRTPTTGPESLEQVLQGAINNALRYLGVHRQGHRDEFEAIGFGAVRRTEEWLSSSNTEPAT